MRLDSFTKNSLIMFAASSLGSFFNLFYQLVMVRVVPKEVFASLNSPAFIADYNLRALRVLCYNGYQAHLIPQGQEQ